MMFVIQVKTGCEASAAATLTRLGFNIKAPQKVMRIRKGGVWKHEVKPVFPGYIFLEADTYIEAAGYYKVKKTSRAVMAALGMVDDGESGDNDIEEAKN